MSFLSITTFPLLLEICGIWTCIWIFAVICTIGFVFTLFAITETKGQNMNQISI